MVDANCLDCFAGSGALGLKRCRVMPPATLLEMERGVAQTLQNLATLKATNAKVVNTAHELPSAQQGRRSTWCLLTRRSVKKGCWKRHYRCWKKMAGWQTATR